METQASAIFRIASWDEDTYAELDGGGKLVRARVKKSYTGEMDGEGNVEYLMAYRPGGSASFVGLESFVGRVGERSGGMILEHRGVFDVGGVESTWAIVPGSGTGGLEGLRGTVAFASGHREEYPVTLDYEATAGA